MRSGPLRPLRGPIPGGALALALGALGLAIGCGPSERAPPERPSLVLVSIDTLRADRVGSYGYFRATTPAIDRFAEEALVFENAIAPMATTLPSHASMMTGTHPVRHGVVSNLMFLKRPLQPREGLQTLAQLLRREGYRTAAFTSAAPLSRATGIDAGFAHFEAPPARESDEQGRAYRAGRTIGPAIDWLREAEHPHFAFVHLFDAHWPYAPPERFEGRFEPGPELARYLRGLSIEPSLVPDAASVSSRYDAEVRYADAQLGRLLRFLERSGRYERTIVVVTSDHGEGLHQHGVLQHGVLYNEQIRVPLVIRFPHGPTGRRQALASLVDLPSTLAGHGGLPIQSEAFDGIDLLEERRRAALSQRALREKWPSLNFTLTRAGWKYWYFEEGEDRLYELGADPHERRNAIAEHPERAERMRRTLHDRVERFGTREGLEVTDEVPPPLREQLRALGYVE